MHVFHSWQKKEEPFLMWFNSLGQARHVLSILVPTFSFCWFGKIQKKVQKIVLFVWNVFVCFYNSSSEFL